MAYLSGDKFETDVKSVSYKCTLQHLIE